MTTVSVTLPFVPRSLKNHARIGRGRFYTDPAIAEEQTIMRVLTAQALRKVGHSVVRGALWPDQEVEVTAVRNVQAGTLTVTARALAPKPKGKTGRDRDTQNLLESLLDAWEGLVYTDDRQVAAVTIRRAQSTGPKPCTQDEQEAASADTAAAKEHAERLALLRHVEQVVEAVRTARVPPTAKGEIATLARLKRARGIEAIDLAMAEGRLCHSGTRGAPFHLPTVPDCPRCLSVPTPHTPLGNGNARVPAPPFPGFAFPERSGNAQGTRERSTDFEANTTSLRGSQP